MTRREWIALGVAALVLMAGVRAMRWGIDKGDPRRALIRRIRAEADPRRDIVIIADDAPELVAAASPVPAVWGSPPWTDLRGFHRMYVVANAEGPLGPFEARLGRPTEVLGPTALAWNLEGLRTVQFDLSGHLLDHARARREGGRFDGPCVRQGNTLHCNSPDEWNHLRVDDHPMNGTPIRCVFAHPQDDSTLVIEAPDVPRARWLVGIVGIDDGAFRVFNPNGSTVVNHVTFTPSDGAPVTEAEVIAPNRQGPTPYRILLGGHPGALRFAITTESAGARQYCFTAVATE